jgi:ATP-dependent DNA helicase RecQ
LILLAQQGLVKYIPRRKTPYIYYAQERLQLEYVRITAACYEDRLARYQQQIQAMLDYATLPSEAKPEDFLLQYFGETADVGEQK